MRKNTLCRSFKRLHWYSSQKVERKHNLRKAIGKKRREKVHLILLSWLQRTRRHKYVTQMEAVVSKRHRLSATRRMFSLWRQIFQQQILERKQFQHADTLRRALLLKKLFDFWKVFAHKKFRTKKLRTIGIVHVYVRSLFKVIKAWRETTKEIKSLRIKSNTIYEKYRKTQMKNIFDLWLQSATKCAKARLQLNQSLIRKVFASLKKWFFILKCFGFTFVGGNIRI